jgi:hypothetical protein
MGYWDQSDEGPRWPTLVAGAVVGALLVGLIWFVQAWTTRGELDEPATSSAGEVGPRQTDPERPPDRLSRCEEVFEAQTEPLKTAEASLAQWEIHIGAMNKLVTGAITLAQANQFWEETRISAHELVHHHASAVQKYDHRTARCPRTKPGAMPEAEARCVKAVAERGLALYRASVAEATWWEHVHHMEMLRDGHMSPDEATRLWLMSWRQGARELRAYRNAASAAQGQTC